MIDLYDFYQKLYFYFYFFKQWKTAMTVCSVEGEYTKCSSQNIKNKQMQLKYRVLNI